MDTQIFLLFIHVSPNYSHQTQLEEKTGFYLGYFGNLIDG